MQVIRQVPFRRKSLNTYDRLAFHLRNRNSEVHRNCQFEIADVKRQAEQELLFQLLMFRDQTFPHRLGGGPATGTRPGKAGRRVSHRAMPEIWAEFVDTLNGRQSCLLAVLTSYTFYSSVCQTESNQEESLGGSNADLPCELRNSPWAKTGLL